MPQCGPKRLQKPNNFKEILAFHAGNTGSNPVGDTNFFNNLQVKSGNRKDLWGSGEGFLLWNFVFEA
jgi:hypothetical protein